MYSSFHCLCLLNLSPIITPSDFLSTANFFCPLPKTTQNKKRRMKIALLFCAFCTYLFLYVVFKMQHIGFFYGFSFLSQWKNQKSLPIFIPAPLPRLHLPLSGHTVQREYPRKYTAAAYLPPAPDHTHNTSRR